MAVPDVILVEGIANGLPDPGPSLKLIRADGRYVVFFREPTRKAAA